MEVPRHDTDFYPEFVADAGPADSPGYVRALARPASSDMQMVDEVANHDVGLGSNAEEEAAFFLRASGHKSPLLPRPRSLIQ